MKKTMTIHEQIARPIGCGMQNPFAARAKRIASAIGAAALLLFTSCNEEGYDPDAAPFMMVTPTVETITFGAEGKETYTFQITTNQPVWLAHSDQEWCKVVMNHDAGTFVVSAIAAQADTPHEPATITVSAGKAGEMTFTATQATVEEVEYDVYLAGNIITENSTREVVSYWKNGVRTDLTDPETYAYCVSTAASDKSFYFAGLDNGVNCYWKDGEKIEVPEIDIQSMAVENESVYLLGNNKYWNDGTTVEITTQYFTGKSIAVTEGAVYVPGQVYLTLGGSSANLAYLWNDGRAVQLKVPVRSTHTDAFCAIGSGGSVYVGGFYMDDNYTQYACYWKDGECTTLKTPDVAVGNYAAVEQICVENETVYMAGYYGDGNNENLCYWTNDACTKIDLPADAENKRVYGIAVVDENIYVAGSYTLDGKDHTGYWLNGAWVELDQKGIVSVSIICGIAVLKK